MQVRRPNAQDDVDVWVGFTEEEIVELEEILIPMGVSREDVSETIQEWFNRVEEILGL